MGFILESRYYLLCYIYTNESNRETCNRYECDTTLRVDEFAKLRWGDLRRY